MWQSTHVTEYSVGRILRWLNTWSREESCWRVERHEVRCSGCCHGMTSWEWSCSWCSWEPTSFQRMSCTFPGSRELSSSSLHDIPYLPYPSWLTRGDLLSWSMASWGEGAGNGNTRLGGLPGLEWEIIMTITRYRDKQHQQDYIQHSWFALIYKVFYCCFQSLQSWIFIPAFTISFKKEHYLEGGLKKNKKIRMCLFCVLWNSLYLQA